MYSVVNIMQYNNVQINEYWLITLRLIFREILQNDYFFIWKHLYKESKYKYRCLWMKNKQDHVLHKYTYKKK